MDIPLYFYIAYDDLERFAAGSNESTLKVLDLLCIEKDLEMDILEIGCGVGADTLVLADYFKNSVIDAVDLFPHYLSVLDDKIKENGLESRVFTNQMDMNDLDFANEEMDLIFAHASAEIMGFKKALNRWKRILKPNSYLVVSDLTWISKPTKESIDFWKNNYAEIDTVENKISQLEKLGFECINYYILDKSEFDSYYSQLEKNLNQLKFDKSAKVFINNLKNEITVSKNNDFTYVYYILRKG